MEMLQVKESQLVTTHGQPVHLHGTCIGGWMNMENFIDGYPGTERGLRDVMQYSYARLFKGMSEAELDRVLQK